MTRATLKRKMRWITFWLAVVLVVALAAKLAEIGLWKLPFGDSKELGKAVYEFLKDMAVVIVTIAAAYLAAILQRRSKFIESLEEEWRGIVRTKSELFAYCEKQDPSYDDYIAAFRCISDTIDGMRIVYRNVGETDTQIGLHPYVPLQDMRRAFQTLDPSKRETAVDPQERKLVRDAILQCWYALRETFLEELDLEEPEEPILVWGAARTKRSGATAKALGRQKQQELSREGARRDGTGRKPDIDKLLEEAWNREHGKGKSAPPQ